MDAYQQPNRFMRPPPPPPPSTADPHYSHHQQQPPRQPGPWFSNQFQYHPSHSPSPPPTQWAPPPPHSDHLNPSAYPPPPHPYSHQNQFPPPPHRPYLPPPPPHPHSQVPQGYSQEWGNPNWGHHQAYPVHNNEEDWAARAKAWATAKTAMDNQPPPSQFSPASRPDEQGRYNDQYPQVVESHYPEMGAHSQSASSYQHYPANRPPVGHFQETASVSTGLFSYAPDAHAHYTGRNGSMTGDSNAAFSHQEALQSSSVHQQEVPSSYSSVTGREQYADRNEHPYTSMPFPASSAQEGQHHTQSAFANQPYAYGSQPANLQPDLSDQPLDFAPRFNSDHDPHVHANYSHPEVGGPARGVDSVATMPSAHTWGPPIVPNYPPIPPGPQHDPSVAVPSPVPVHTVPPFGGFPGPGFQPSVPSAGTPYGLGAGNALHAATSFPGDVYGISGVSERPKKAPVPNWLREEIIKKKAVMTGSSQEHLKEETPIEDEDVDRSLGKGDQGDSRSIESSRSTEEEDDDEDYVEAARTAAINSEIKRILTEVLLKVTDELFDEIATKVISEDDQTVDVDHKTVMSNHKVSVSPPPPAVPTPKASAKVLIPIQAKEAETETSGKSNSITPGDVLGLASYASDEDEEDEIERSSKPKSGTERISDEMHGATENGSSQVEKDGSKRNTAEASDVTGLIKSNNNHGNVTATMDGRESGNGNVDAMHSTGISGDKDNANNVDGKMLYRTNGPSSKDNVEAKIIMRSEQPSRNIDVKKLRDDPSGKETRIKSDKNDLHESKRSSSGKDYKETDSSKIRSDEKGDEKRRRQDEKHVRNDQMDDRYASKQRAKEQGARIEEKAKESESRKRSTHLPKEERKEKERSHRSGAKEDANKKRERVKDKEDGSRQKLDSSKHKRRRTSSESSRGKNDSSDEASDDSRRKLHSRRRNISPSPVRSRRRQVSRSPHSKHSQRRHSPYSSFESTRGRRSRSKSPVRRQR